MALQLGIAVRNGRGNAIEAAIGASAKLELRTGAPPATPATADSGTLVSSYALASDWANAFAAGAAAPWLANLPLSVAASNAGIIGHFRLKDNAGTTVGLQGTITETAGGGDMIVDNNDVNAGQITNITGFNMTEGGA